MANESIRIRTTPGESKNIKVKLEQDFNFLEILSLKISQEDLYQTFCADYGVVVGRVIVNRGFGVPNAKVSIFIPITDEDERNALIKDFYPFKTPYDKKEDGKRYNLLLSKATCELNTAVGSFPMKEQVLNNDIVLEVFEKYYKYTTKTNYAGDFMLFGVPVGNHILHMDVDLSDVGAISLRPYDLIDEGYPEKLFESRVEFKSGTNLDALPQLKVGNVGIQVVPFWGDPENCEIGITRADFTLDTEIKTNALFFGSIFSDTGKMAINMGCNPKNRMGEQDDLRTGEGLIEMIRVSEYDQSEWYDDFKIKPLFLENFSVEGGELIDKDGNFAFSVPMNLGHVVTDEFGNLIPSIDPSIGVATRGMYRFKMNFSESSLKFRTAHILFPSMGRDFGGTRGAVNGDAQGGTEDQRFTDDITAYRNLELDFHDFEWKQIYTIAHYIKKYKKGGNRFSFVGLKHTDASGINNYLPYTTIIWKFDIIYMLMTLFIEVKAFLIRLIIVLVSLSIGVCGQIRFSFTIFRRSFSFTIIPHFCFDIEPFRWLRDLFPTLPSGVGKGFFLPCEDGGPNGEGYEINLYACDSPDYCTNSPCLSCSCIKFGDNNPGNANTNVCLQLLKKWECCAKYNAAETRNVLRRTFVDAWLLGSAYLFQYKYKSKKNGKEKFCGPGSDHRRGDNYRGQKCCLDSDQTLSCDRCLVRGPGQTNGSFNTMDYHRDWHNAAITGANDINDSIYCNALHSTKIVSLGRIEMCLETLEQIEMGLVTNEALKKFAQKPNYYVGTNSESGWDVNLWTNSLKDSSYADPREVIVYLAYRPAIDCQYRDMFYKGGGCHEYEIKDYEHFYVKEITKIYNSVQETYDGIEYVFNQVYDWSTKPLADSVELDVRTETELNDLNINGGFEVDINLANRFSPCGANGACSPTLWTNPAYTEVGYEDLSKNNNAFDAIITPGDRNNKNTRSNTPYYYFGIKPGRTSLRKLKKDFFFDKN